MQGNGSRRLQPSNVPIEDAEWLKSFCDAQDIQLWHLISTLARMTRSPSAYNRAYWSREIERTLEEKDPALLRRLGPWKTRVHSELVMGLGRVDVWVEIPCGTKSEPESKGAVSDATS